VLRPKNATLAEHPFDKQLFVRTYTQDLCPCPTACAYSTMIEIMDDPSQNDRYVEGTAAVARVGRFRLPVFELRQDGRLLASMGRSGLIRIMFGRGQRVELADGSKWRVQALGIAGAICPAVINAERARIAISSPREGKYGLNGKDFGYFLYAADRKRFSRADNWILRHHETEVARLTRYPASISTDEPVHVGAVILSFVLMQHGILGESASRFNFSWDS